MKRRMNDALEHSKTKYNFLGKYFICVSQQMKFITLFSDKTIQTYKSITTMCLSAPHSHPCILKQLTVLKDIKTIGLS